MKKENKACIPPDKLDTSLWRYMSFDKLKHLVTSKQLFFSRADLLGDNSEGSHTHSFPKSDYKMLIESGGKVREELLSSEKMFDVFRKITFVNCWHINENESSAMWSLYAREGVAVQTKYKDFVNVIDRQLIHDVFIGCVRYINHQTDSFPDHNNGLHPYFHKQKSYESERELRGVVRDYDLLLYALYAPDLLPKGVLINIDIKGLIGKILLPPNIDSAFRQKIISFCDENELGDLICESEISIEPIW